MSFYSRLAEHYDLLFPFDELQFSFLEKVLDRDGSVAPHRYLDIGCGTGTMLSAFSDRFAQVYGLDLDPSLLALAAQKMLPGEGKKVDLLEGDMRNLRGFFPEEEFSFITCLGNTLVHITSSAAIIDFLLSVRSIMEGQGVFVFQIINYDRILDQGIRGLSPIVTEGISFERYYSLPKENGLIDFDTVLNDTEEEGDEVTATVELYPVRKEEMERSLLSAGFTKCTFYGDFNGSSWKPDSLLLIGVCS